jgi:class 3 adenylate cyclase
MMTVLLSTGKLALIPIMASRNLTILLTDIKEFTQKTSQKSRADILTMLEMHKKLVLPVLEKHGGRLVKTIGDAFMMVFDSPTDAVLSGMAVQVALAEYNHGRTGNDRIDVRIAINVGEVTLSDDDIFGDPVNITARIEAIAEAGEVYFTEAVYLAMNKQEVPSAEIGMLQLKGLPEKVRVYKVKREDPIEEMPTVEADLATATPVRSAAPEPATPEAKAAPKPASVASAGASGTAAPTKLKRFLALAIDVVLVMIITGVLTGNKQSQVQVSKMRRDKPSTPGSIKIDENGIEIGGVRIDDAGVHGGQIQITEDGIKIKAEAGAEPEARLLEAQEQAHAATEVLQQAQARIVKLENAKREVDVGIKGAKGLARSALRVGRSPTAHKLKAEKLSEQAKELREQIKESRKQLRAAEKGLRQANKSAKNLVEKKDSKPVHEEILYEQDGLRFAKQSKKDDPAFAIFWVLYQVFFLSLWSATPGGKVAKVRLVLYDTGERVDWKIALARTLMTFVSTVPLLAGWIWALFQKEGRGWHDIIAGTRVVLLRPDSSSS